MQSVSAASEETSTEIVHVSEILLSMNTDMKNIEDSKSQENVDNMQIISKKVQRVPVLWMCTIMNDIICCIKISKEKLVIK